MEVQIEADDIGGLLFKLRIIALDVAVERCDFSPLSSPRSSGRLPAQVGRYRYLAEGSLCPPVRRLPLRRPPQLCLYRRCRLARPTSPVAGFQTSHPVLFQTSFPARNRQTVSAQFHLNPAVTHPLGQSQDQPRFENLFRRQRA